MAFKLQDITGRRFNYWTVVSYSHRANHLSWYLCKCECGAEKLVPSQNLKNGRSKSCGCFRKVYLSKLRRQYSIQVKSEVSVWNGMKSRCRNKRDRIYKHYGGRGIKVCDRWLNSFDAFIEDMGRRPSKKHSIDRIDVNGDYEPSNCRWTTQKEQARNTRRNVLVTFNGETRCISDWAERTGIKYGTLKQRIRHGWPIEIALNPTLRKGTGGPVPGRFCKEVREAMGRAQ